MHRTPRIFLEESMAESLHATEFDVLYLPMDELDDGLEDLEINVENVSCAESYETFRTIFGNSATQNLFLTSQVCVCVCVCVCVYVCVCV